MRQTCRQEERGQTDRQADSKTGDQATQEPRRRLVNRLMQNHWVMMAELKTTNKKNTTKQKQRSRVATHPASHQLTADISTWLRPAADVVSRTGSFDWIRVRKPPPDRQRWCHLSAGPAGLLVFIWAQFPSSWEFSGEESWTVVSLHGVHTVPEVNSSFSV